MLIFNFSKKGHFLTLIMWLENVPESWEVELSSSVKWCSHCSPSLSRKWWTASSFLTTGRGTEWHFQLSGTFSEVVASFQNSKVCQRWRWRVLETGWLGGEATCRNDDPLFAAPRYLMIKRQHFVFRFLPSFHAFTKLKWSFWSYCFCLFTSTSSKQPFLCLSTNALVDPLQMIQNYLGQTGQKKKNPPGRTSFWKTDKSSVQHDL